MTEFHTTFHMWEDNHTHYVLTDTMEIHYIVRIYQAREITLFDYKSSISNAKIEGKIEIARNLLDILSIEF